MSLGWLVAMAVASPDSFVQQGRLLDAAGEAIEGEQAVTFRLYASGTELWSEQDTVTFAQGYYATVLGDSAPLDDVDLSNGDLELGIQVGTESELAPRIPVGASLRTIRGPVNIRDVGAPTPCTAENEGTLRYRDGEVQVCDGIEWSAIVAASTCSSGTTTFAAVGANQTFIVPQGCSTLQVHAWGAGGGGGYAGNGQSVGRHGGPGGYTRATVDVEGGEAYVVVVGGKGRRNTGSGNSNTAFGFAGAPYGASTVCAVGGGGGLSGLFGGSPSQSTAVLVAGGGGGSSGYTWGGNGNDANSGGQGGLTGAGGNTVWEGGAGGGYQGGTRHTRSTVWATYEAGEGGSGFASGEEVRAGTATISAAPWQTRNPPATTLPEYQAGVGVGGRWGAYGANCDDAGDGLVVIHYSE